jgi:WD40 repeat protein
VRIWPVTGNAEPTILRGHQGFVWQLTYSSDGRWLISAGKDGTVRIWNTAANTAPVTYSGFGASVESVDVGLDGTQMVTAHDDGTVRVWRCDACAPIADVLTLARRLDDEAAAGQRSPR